VILSYDKPMGMLGYLRGDWKLVIGGAGDATLYEEPTTNHILNPPQLRWMDRFGEGLYAYLALTSSAEYAVGFKELVRELRAGLYDQVLGTCYRMGASGCPVLLFNIKDDPQEVNNLASARPEILASMNESFLNMVASAPLQFDWHSFDRELKLIKSDPRPEFSHLYFHGPWLADDVDPVSRPQGSMLWHLLYLAVVQVLTFLVPSMLVLYCCCCRRTPKAKEKKP